MRYVNATQIGHCDISVVPKANANGNVNANVANGLTHALNSASPTSINLNSHCFGSAEIRTPDLFAGWEALCYIGI